MSTEPLTPADSDLQDFPFMPLMVQRLRKSKAWVKARRNPALGFYMINLWASSWHEVPAGSLEDDDDVLADAAMCDPAKWPKVRDDALRGWVTCTDGRLYHPVVAERVIEAWTAKTERKEKNEHENARKKLEREEKQQLFAILKSAGIHKPWNTPLSELRTLVQNLSAGQDADGSGTVRHLSRLREGQGQGQGQGQGDSKDSEAKASGGKPPMAPKPVKEKTPAEQEKSRLWAWIKTVMVDQQTCETIKEAGDLAGKLSAKYGADVFIAALREGERMNPGNAHTYVIGLCEIAAGKRTPLGRPGQMTDEQREATNAVETQKAKDMYRQRYGGGDVVDAETRVVDQPAIEGATP